MLHSNAHQFCKNEYFFIILGNLMSIRTKFVFLFQVQISIFRISFFNTAILSYDLVFLNKKKLFYTVNILVNKLYKF